MAANSMTFYKNAFRSHDANSESTRILRRSKFSKAHTTGKSDKNRSLVPADSCLRNTYCIYGINSKQ
jgi:hypothetical protein